MQLSPSEHKLQSRPRAQQPSSIPTVGGITKISRCDNMSLSSGDCGRSQAVLVAVSGSMEGVLEHLRAKMRRSDRSPVLAVMSSS